ncbi:MAG: hypothetical protein JSW52_05240 [Candidatus Coatesbacteria bacterium]|nr:MAG: hypothetical protein JSW52_05240 [Candidatus Coatesbacteria bacterium]
MKNILFITMALTVAVYSFGATKRIARVDVDGDIIFDRDAGFSPDVLEVEISEVDGYIYVSTDYSGGFGRFDENGYYDTGFDLQDMHSTYGFDVNHINRLWITGNEVIGDYGLYEYTSDGDYMNGIEDFNPNDTVYEDEYDEVWAIAANVIQEGVHKFTDSGSRLFYKPGYLPYASLAADVPSGAAWFQNLSGGIRELVKMRSNGDEEFRLRNFEFPRDPQTCSLDGSCWLFEHYSGDLIKLNSAGAIIFRDSSFSDIAAIDVNESDGSVWVASNVPKRLVRLDKDGNRQLYKEWPGGDFAHLAVDQRNGTCIVVYEEYRSGAGVNIQPASVGEIKAMYAE